jgi:glycosyltransferase involved in cell wall biosynthesis
VKNSELSLPLISIVIPARNEEDDIRRTLDACAEIDYECKEITVVDDSTDQTPEIVATYADRGVRLVHREQNRNGCCGARNLGMQLAQGEIVVLMNADNVPQSDFLRRLLPHYQRGADYVIIRSVVLNNDSVFGRLVSGTAAAWLEHNPPMEWSEGFSCRRAAAEAVGYIPGDFPIPFCRDWRLGSALSQAGFTKVVDLEIEMKHIVPSTLVDFWRSQVWRGSMSAPAAFYFGRLSRLAVILREVLKAARTVFRTTTVLPVLIQAVRYARYTPDHWRDVPGLFFAKVVQDWAQMVGSFKGAMAILSISGKK